MHPSRHVTFNLMPPLALLSIVLSAGAGQPAGTFPPSTAPRPVIDKTQPPRTSDIAFGNFEFQEVMFAHGGPTLFPIEGEPVVGAEYPVEGRIHEERAVATVSFSTIDLNGELIETIDMARAALIGSSRFLGLMTVPPRPFRVVITGEGVDGRPFRRLDDRVFRPQERKAAKPRLPQGLPPEMAQMAPLIRQAIAEAEPQVLAERRALLAARPAGPIVMPRMRVSDVTYAPLFSAQGRPIGIRIAYNVTFSESGAYDAGLRVLQRYGPDRQGEKMNVLESTITPMPREAHAPHDPIVLNEYRTSPLEWGGEYLYEANTVYHFTADLVPDFVIHSVDKNRSCVHYQKFVYSPTSRKEFAEALASEKPSTYAVHSNVFSNAFKGEIPQFYGAGTFHQSFVAEGARDCGPQPTRRF